MMYIDWIAHTGTQATAWNTRDRTIGFSEDMETCSTAYRIAHNRHQTTEPDIPWYIAVRTP